MKIKDSGKRTEFESGAVRDIQEGKGRCDLLPLDVLSTYFTDYRGGKYENVMMCISNFQACGDVMFLDQALRNFQVLRGWDNSTMALEVAIHFEEGANKYGERNWQKGIPVIRYIDSGIRHYLKFIRGDKDEPHDRSFCWNVLCAMWTCNHRPELNDYHAAGEKKAMEVLKK